VGDNPPTPDPRRNALGVSHQRAALPAFSAAAQRARFPGFRAAQEITAHD
jgi:hypothetical protein